MSNNNPLVKIVPFKSLSIGDSFTTLIRTSPTYKLHDKDEHYIYLLSLSSGIIEKYYKPYIGTDLVLLFEPTTTKL